MKIKQCPKCKRNVLSWNYSLKKYVCISRAGVIGCGYEEDQKELGGFM